MTGFNDNKAWALVDDALPVKFNDVTVWLKPLTNGEKILLAQKMKDTKNFDDVMKCIGESVIKIEYLNTVVDQPEDIISLLVRLEDFALQNKVMNACIDITGLKDVERKNSPSSSAS